LNEIFSETKILLQYRQIFHNCPLVNTKQKTLVARYPIPGHLSFAGIWNNFRANRGAFHAAMAKVLRICGCKLILFSRHNPHHLAMQNDQTSFYFAIQHCEECLFLFFQCLPGSSNKILTIKNSYDKIQASA
jgi:hypothetical protein